MAQTTVFISTNLERTVNVSYQNYAALGTYEATVPAAQPSQAVLQVSGGSSEIATVLIGTASADCPDAAAWSAPKIPGYNFQGWYTLDSNGASLVIQKTSISSNISVSRTTTWGNLRSSLRYVHVSTARYRIVRAVYQPKTAQVVFNGNLGTGAPSAKTATYGKSFTFPSSVPTRDRYRFIGWSTDRDATDATYHASESVNFSASFFSSQSVTFYAVWSYCSVTVVLNPEGGTVSPRYLQVNQGEAYGSIPNPTRTGFSFVGWYDAATGGSQVTSATVCMASASHSIHARWTPSGQPSGIYHTVKLNPFGGSVSTTSVTVEEGSAYGTLPTPVRTGHSFSGWYTQPFGGNVVTSSTPVTSDENHALYARWTASSIVLTFNANGGTVTTATKSVSFGKAVGILPTPILSNKTFSGWFTSTTGGTHVKASTILTVSTTLYAHWNDPLEDGGTAQWIF